MALEGLTSYIGSLISLISNSEIRYEGILFKVHAADSNIVLINVMSFGTEGCRKDAPQVPPSDTVSAYMIFHASHIKALEVKASPPVQSTDSVYQSHYPMVISSTSLFSAGSGSSQDFSPHRLHHGISQPTFQGSLPLYRPSGSSVSRVSSVAGTSGSFHNETPTLVKPDQLLPPRITKVSSHHFSQTSQTDLQLRGILDSLMHANECLELCNYPHCIALKKLFRHTHGCTKRVNGGCRLCKKTWQLLHLHSQECTNSSCKIPRCMDIKKFAETRASLLKTP